MYIFFVEFNADSLPFLGAFTILCCLDIQSSVLFPHPDVPSHSHHHRCLQTTYNFQSKKHKNKTKYFRLRLSDKVGTERPETYLRLT